MELKEQILESSAAEVSATKMWGIGLFCTLIVQSGAVFWWAAQIQSQNDYNTERINKLETGASVILSRESLNDVLLSRDNEIRNLQNQLNRIENKLDKISQ